MQIYFDLLNAFFLIFSILFLAALAGFFSERAGIINIAIDGQMTIGALIYAFVGIYFSSLTSQFGGMLLAMGIVAIFSLLHGIACIKFKSNHLISGVAINLLAAGIAPFVIVVISGNAFLEANFSKFQFARTGWLSSLNIYIFITLFIAALAWFFINKTKFGLRYTASGENPSALDAAGINVYKYRWIALLLSGAMAGLSGAFFVEMSSNVFHGHVFGLGFLGLALLIFGNWRIKRLLFATVIFSFFFTTATYNVTELNFIPIELQRIIPYLLSLIALSIFSKKILAPQAIGKPYDKSVN